MAPAERTMAAPPQGRIARITVIIPAYNAADLLRACLQALQDSTVAPAQVIVADDGSTDGTAEVARRFGVELVSVGIRQGPAKARNLAAAAAREDLLFFIDADVTVHPRTIELVSSAFAEDPALDAIIGSYDDAPADPQFLSQYRNLLHCFVHRSGRRRASTFWSGCGAMRRDVFFAFGGFSEDYRHPSIEDVELGYRLAAAGRKLLLEPSIEVKHHKRWTLWGLLRTDIIHRAIPWTELILRHRSMLNDLNLHVSQRVSVALVFLAAGAASWAAWRWGAGLLAPLLSVLWLALARYWIDAVRWGPRGAVAVGVAWAGAAVLAWTRVDAEVISVLAADPVVWLAGLATLITIGINSPFYRFLAAQRTWLFALGAIPFHLLYHAYSGVAFALVLIRSRVS